jgi:outer membrane protein insertion porin family
MVTFLILLALSAPGQTTVKGKAAARHAAPKAEAWPLVSLRVTGNKIYTQQQILAVAGLKIGQTVSNAQFEAAREKLIATGAFSNAGYHFGPDADGKGYAGTIAVDEVDQLYPFRFEDLPVADAEIRAMLRNREPLFESKMPATKEFLDRVTKEVEQMASAKGLKDHVTAALNPDAPGELAIVFRPSTPRERVAEVRFTGNQEIPAGTLNSTLGLVAIGQSYSENNMRQLIDASIRPLYEARGRMRVSFPKIESKKMETVDGVSVAIQVVEGPVYKLGDVRVDGSGVSVKEVLSAANLKPGEPANLDGVRAGVFAIDKRYRANGYLRSATTFDRQIHDQNLTVDVQYHTAPGPVFKMGTLTIQGLDVTTEPAIRKLWSMTEGKPYNAGYPQLFLDRVKEDGYLENLKGSRFTEDVNESAHTVSVTLYFR